MPDTNAMPEADGPGRTTLSMQKDFRINLQTFEHICLRFRKYTNCLSLVSQSAKVDGNRSHRRPREIIVSLRKVKIVDSMMTMILGMEQVVVNPMEKILTLPRSLMASTKAPRRRRMGEMKNQRITGSKEEVIWSEYTGYQEEQLSHQPIAKRSDLLILNPWI